MLAANSASLLVLDPDVMWMGILSAVALWDRRIALRLGKLYPHLSVADVGMEKPHVPEAVPGACNQANGMSPCSSTGGATHNQGTVLRLRLHCPIPWAVLGGLGLIPSTEWDGRSPCVRCGGLGQEDMCQQMSAAITCTLLEAISLPWTCVSGMLGYM